MVMEFSKGFSDVLVLRPRKPTGHHTLATTV